MVVVVLQMKLAGTRAGIGIQIVSCKSEGTSVLLASQVDGHANPKDPCEYDKKKNRPHQLAVIVVVDQ